MGAAKLSVRCRHAIYAKSHSLSSDRLLSCCDVMGLLIKRVTGSAASKGQVWLRAGGVCLYMSVDWKERAECVCVCVCVSVPLAAKEAPEEE